VPVSASKAFSIMPLPPAAEKILVMDSAAFLIQAFGLKPWQGVRRAFRKWTLV
jgi:hypothetical protein